MDKKIEKQNSQSPQQLKLCKRNLMIQKNGKGKMKQIGMKGRVLQERLGHGSGIGDIARKDLNDAHHPSNYTVKITEVDEDNDNEMHPVFHVESKPTDTKKS